MLQRFLSWFGPKARPLTALGVLEAGLDIEPADRDLTRVVPIILPLELLDAAWPGPIVRIANLPFCVAWAAFGEMNTFFYVTEREAKFWDDAGIDWRAIALANLARLSADRPASGKSSMTMASRS